jgi:hypothetical protein
MYVETHFLECKRYGVEVNAMANAKQQFDVVQVRMSRELGEWIREHAKRGFRAVSREVVMRLEAQKTMEQLSDQSDK